MLITAWELNFSAIPPGCPCLQQATGGAAQGLRSSGPSGVSNDDLAILDYMHHETQPADLPRAAGKTRLLVVPLNSDFCVPEAAAVLRTIQEQLERDGLGGSVALGVLSMLGFESTREHLAAHGVDMERIDCMVCNSGADAWIHLKSGQWDADEQYEGESCQQALGKNTRTQPRFL